MSQKRISDFFKDPVGHGSTKRQNTTNVECVSIQVSLPALPSKDHPPIRPEEESLDEPAMLTAAAPSVDSVAATCGEASTSYSLSEEPFQPKDFSFPARRFANENFSRSFKGGCSPLCACLHACVCFGVRRKEFFFLTLSLLKLSNQLASSRLCYLFITLSNA